MRWNEMKLSKRTTVDIDMRKREICSSQEKNNPSFPSSGYKKGWLKNISTNLEGRAEPRKGSTFEKDIAPSSSTSNDHFFFLHDNTSKVSNRLTFTSSWVARAWFSNHSSRYLCLFDRHSSRCRCGLFLVSFGLPRAPETRYCGRSLCRGGNGSSCGNM